MRRSYRLPRMQWPHKPLSTRRGQRRAERPTLSSPVLETPMSELLGLEECDLASGQLPPCTRLLVHPRTHPRHKGVLSRGKYSRNLTWELGGVGELLKTP